MVSTESDLSLTDWWDELYVDPHYTESYRLAIFALLCGGKEAYEEYLRFERISHFLSEEEISFILENAEEPVVDLDDRLENPTTDKSFPSEYPSLVSDEEIPELELEWVDVNYKFRETSISMLFHPPRRGTPTIKEVVRKTIQDARQVIAIAMDAFTDRDIFKEIISATQRGVSVYILLDDHQVGSFLKMSQSAGINVQDIRNLCVRTIRGVKYRCQSGMKFHGGLDQRFLLVDGKTVLFGTYSFTWSFEKINRSMIQVITGQLVSSYDEEFRRLYAHSIVPAVLSNWSQSFPSPKESLLQKMPNARYFSLDHLDYKSRVMREMRASQSGTSRLNRGSSVQERLHQPPHCNAVELQKVNSTIRLKMGTRGLGVPAAAERTGSKLRGGRGLQQTNASSQQDLKHQVPFNSDTSLHRWKIDTYLKEEASPDATLPKMPLHSSHTGLTENKSQLIQTRSMAIRSKLEEMRIKRLSLQESTTLRKRHESFNYSSAESAKANLRPTLDPRTQNSYKQGHYNPNGPDDETGQVLMDDQRSHSHHTMKTIPDQRILQTPNQKDQSLPRTKSDADLETKPADSSLISSHLHSSNLSVHQSRMMESLIEIPEERETSNSRVNGLDSELTETNQEMSEDRKCLNFSSESRHQDQVRVNSGSKQSSLGPYPPRAEQESIHSKAKTHPELLGLSMGSHPSVDTQSGLRKEGTTKHGGLELQRNRIMKNSLLLADQKEDSRKEETSVQRRFSLRSQNAWRPTRGSKKDLSPVSTVEQTTIKGQLPRLSRSQNSLSGSSEPERHKSLLSNLSPHYSTKRRPLVEQGQSSRTLDDEGANSPQTKRETAYSQYEHVLEEKSQRKQRTLEKVKTSSLNRRVDGDPVHQTHSGPDNKLGRFIQRVGNLINKNKE